MSQYGWNNCPISIKDQIENLVNSFQTILKEDITGIYLHGSLAMGCFNPPNSDIDILVINKTPLNPDDKSQLLKILLLNSSNPCPVETSFLVEDTLKSWQHPAPFDFHFSEAWRNRMQSVSGIKELQELFGDNPVDIDLAAHCVITRKFGITLVGKSVDQVIPMIPSKDYLNAILVDAMESLDGIKEKPVYAILNTCRVLAYLRDGFITSKQTGGEWGMVNLPSQYQFIIQQALNNYAGKERQQKFDPKEIEHFRIYLHSELIPEG